jgi:hypothetical protein
VFCYSNGGLSYLEEHFSVIDYGQVQDENREIIKIHRWDNWKYHRRLEAGESKRSIAEDLKVPQTSLHVTTVEFRNTCKFTSVKQHALLADISGKWPFL